MLAARVVEAVEMEQVELYLLVSHALTPFC